MEPSKALEKLSSIVDNNKDKEKGGSKGWVASIVIFFVVLIAIFVFAWVANRDAKELAKLRHEKNKKKVEDENLRIEHKAAENDKEKEKLQGQITAAKNEIRKLDEEIRVADKAHEENVKNINSITSWRDI